MKQTALLIVAAAALGLGAAPVLAAEPSPAQVATPYAQSFVSHHAGVFGGHPVDYTATVANTVLADGQGRPTVNMVSTAYVRDGVADPSRRPVIFMFSGGPSNASIAYHMRFMGPRQVIDPPAGAGSQPVLRDNHDALLDLADLVFVDTAETGFSRVLPAGKRVDFYTVNGDTASIGQFIGSWLKAHGREASPRYVMGGSYGSVRAIRIAWDSRKTRPVDGVIMTANCLMLQEEVGVVGDVLPLATYAATAVYHGKVDRRGRTDDQIVAETYRFAIDDYLPALSRVQDLSAAERAAMAEKLHRITGVAADVILAHDLVISNETFTDNLLKGEGRKLSNVLDGRQTAPATAAKDEPADSTLPMFRIYMARELGVAWPMSEYRESAPDTDTWSYKGPDGAPRNDWPGMTRDYLAANPKGFVYSANGLYDLQSVLGQAHWLLSRTALPRDRIYMHDYPGGHALYYVPETASLMLKELREILQARS